MFHWLFAQRPAVNATLTVPIHACDKGASKIGEFVFEPGKRNFGLISRSLSFWGILSIKILSFLKSGWAL